MIDNALTTEFDSIKEINEKILWVAKPKYLPFILNGAIYLVMAVMGALVWLLVVNKMMHFPIKVLLFMVSVSMLHGLWSLVYKILSYKNTFYAYSDKRVLMRTGIIKIDFITLDFERITYSKVSVNFVEKGYQTGSIRFNKFYYGKNSVGYECEWEAIEQPHEVFQQLKAVKGEDVQFDKSKADNVFTTEKRIWAMLFDYFVMSIIGFGFTMLLVIGLADRFQMKNPHFSFEMVISAVLSMAGWIVVLSKDCVGGRSIAKRTFNLQLVDNETGQVATPLQCFIRNLTVFIFPLELIMAFINPHRRLGDQLAGTKLVLFDPKLEQPSFDLGKFLMPIAFAIALITFGTWALQDLIFKFVK